MAFVDRSAHPASPGGGRDVEVRCSFDAGWYRGFRIERAEVSDDGVVGYVIRRVSDGSVLPHLFPPQDIRGAAAPTPLVAIPR